jgi:hypothetical protein
VIDGVTIESQTIEWKEQWKDEYLAWISGFANSSGGTLVLGKNDTGEPIGVINAKKLMTDLPNKIRDGLGIIVEIHLLCEKDKDLIEIKVPAYPVPISYKGRYYIRSGATNQRLSGHALESFILNKRGASWDNLPLPGFTLDNISDQAVKHFKKLAAKKGRIPADYLDEPKENLLERLGLIKDGYLTNAAMLLFSEDPQRWQQGAYVKIGFFRNHADLEYQDEIRGPLIDQIDRIIEVIHLKYMKARITYEGIQRIERYFVPDEALREAILNAICHKDYSRSIPIQISVYDWDSGAYADYGVNVGKTAVYGGLGPYDIENASIVSNTIYTNKVFSTAYRGFGHLETLWTVERQTDILSQKLGIDPYEFRMMNMLKPGSKTISQEVITESSGSPCDCLSAVVKEIGWTGRKTQEEREREWKTGKVRGKGFAMIQKAPAMPANTATSVIMQMVGDGHVNIMMGAVDYGQGALTALAQIAAQELDIPFEMVKMIPQTNTETNPYDWNTVASKLTFMAGNAVIQASRRMVAQMKEIAGQALRCSPDVLAHADGYIYKKHTPEMRIAYKDMALGYAYPDGMGIGGPLISHGVCMADGLTNLDPKTGKGLPALAWTFGAHAVEIELDVETGNIDVLKVASAFDIGQVINERMVYSQVVGGVMQGIGSAILEGYKFSDDNVLLNPSFTDNKIPTMKDMPFEVVPIYIENPQLNGPYGARGIAEHTMISVPSAIGNALYEATGINFYRLPLTPENVMLGILSGKKDCR